MKEKTIYAGGNVVNYSSEGQLTADTLEKQVEVLKKLLETNRNGYFKIKIRFSDNTQEANDLEVDVNEVVKTVTSTIHDKDVTDVE